MMHLGRIVEQWARERPDQAALISDDRHITFAELNTSINRVANGFKKLGICSGDRVAIMLPNIPEFIYSFYACQKIGAIAVPFNTMYKGKEIAHILKDCGAKAIVCLTNFVPLINEIRCDLPDLAHIITTGERTLTLADPDATIFVQAVLSKKQFTDLDDAYRKTGTAATAAFHKLGCTNAWYRHRGSIRLKGRKLAGFLISEVEDTYLILMVCFIGPFDPSDFFAALWVPAEIKDKMLEPLTSLEEEMGSRPQEEAVRNALVASFEESFGVTIREGAMTREERFGYQKQRSLSGRHSKSNQPAKQSPGEFIKNLFTMKGRR